LAFPDKYLDSRDCPGPEFTENLHFQDGPETINTARIRLYLIIPECSPPGIPRSNRQSAGDTLGRERTEFPVKNSTLSPSGLPLRSRL
jgi:hypothetical protein